jgi:thioredoxin reductase (NADPH)
LRNPGETEIARAIGMIGGPSNDRIYDVAIVGCGPAGLATAV